MLRKIYLKKILISLSALFALSLIYLIPTENRELKNIKSETVFIDSTVQTNNIYLLDSHNMLGLTNIMVDGEDIETKAKDLIESLIQGSTKQDQIPNGFKSIIPVDTKVLNIKLEENILSIDFSKEILNVKKELEEKMIEAITYTMTSLKDIKGIKIYVEGSILKKLPQTNINLPDILDRKWGINKQYDITSTNKITNVTTYYISKNKNDYYYVPVTKYLNDEREKIKIVIDELESSKAYNTNLMSFLNDNVKLLSVEQIEDTLSLNFNEYIYSDLDTREILEEVIYTICLSIEDNYNVKNVIFNVNNEEIYKSVLKSIE
jgi:germination protein M